MRYLDFIIIGASKCGSTSLHELLIKHPNVCMSEPKETNYFALNEEHFNLVDYSSYFKHYESGNIKGEVSPYYSECKILTLVPKRIYKYNKDAKLICIIREPTELKEDNLKILKYANKDTKIWLKE